MNTAARAAFAAALALSLATAAAASADDALVREGRALYRGEQAWRQPPTLHGVPMPGAACIQCHGSRGAARSEAGVAVPAIAWRHLAQPARQRPPYDDDAAVLHAITHGRDAAGRGLSAPMPRYALDAAEQRALLAWLRVMGTEAAPAPGVTPTQVVLGTVLPLSGPQAAAGAAIRAALERGVAQANQRGGVFGRRLALEVADAGPAGAPDAALRLIDSGRVVALVAALMPEPDAALRERLDAQDIPLIATLGQPTVPETHPRISWLLPSLAEQAAALAKELRTRCPAARAGLRVLHWRHGQLAALTPELTPEQAGVPPPQWLPVADADALQRALATSPQPPTLALLPAALTPPVRAALARQGQCLGTLAVLSGPVPAAGGPPELVGLPMPSPVGDGSGAARGGLWTQMAEAAFAVALEALSRAGRPLDGARLGEAVDSLQRLEPTPGVVLGFSPRKRHGASAVRLWQPGSAPARP